MCCLLRWPGVLMRSLQKTTWRGVMAAKLVTIKRQSGKFKYIHSRGTTPWNLQKNSICMGFEFPFVDDQGARAFFFAIQFHISIVRRWNPSPDRNVKFVKIQQAKAAFPCWGLFTVTVTMCHWGAFYQGVNALQSGGGQSSTSWLDRQSVPGPGGGWGFPHQQWPGGGGWGTSVGPGGGSTLAVSNGKIYLAAKVALNTTLAGAGASIAAAVLSRLINKHIDIDSVMNGTPQGLKAAWRRRRPKTSRLVSAFT